jgi:septation ring formation regulator EzrA
MEDIEGMNHGMEDLMLIETKVQLRVIRNEMEKCFDLVELNIDDINKVQKEIINLSKFLTNYKTENTIVLVTITKILNILLLIANDNIRRIPCDGNSVKIKGYINLFKSEMNKWKI